MPPPSSGGVAILEMLNILEGYKLDQLQHNSAVYLHLITESMKHTFADRAHFLGDPDFVHVPVRKLTAKEYAGWIRGRIAPDKTYPPTFYGYYNYNAEKGGTTHFSVIDRFGNAVACTQSVNTRFGSKLMASGTGIVLNNEMDDFAIHADAANVYGLIGNEANSLQPKKRPLSSMSPTIILRDGRPELVVGAAGGPRIISCYLADDFECAGFSHAGKAGRRRAAGSSPMAAQPVECRREDSQRRKKSAGTARPRPSRANRARGRSGHYLAGNNDEGSGRSAQNRAGADGMNAAQWDYEKCFGSAALAPPRPDG